MLELCLKSLIPLQLIFFWDSFGLPAMFLGKVVVNFSCQLQRSVGKASPRGCRLGSGLVPAGSNCWHPDALSNFHIVQGH